MIANSEFLFNGARKSPFKSKTIASESEGVFMNQPNKPASSKIKLLWALLAVFLLSAMGLGVVAVMFLKRSGVTVSLPGLGASITPIDLAAYYDKSGSW
ncbi:MAG TPA: hypothetical protein VK846_11800, partial [Candidatus Limnocylindria bacterium]|nr:hypothetical protein [Candidatus Limnocylindria bacterium]